MGADLEVEDLTVTFTLRSGRVIEAVHGVSLQLRQGQIVGLVGESGSGKSTVLLAILGLLPPNATVSGRILLDGKDILAGGESSIAPHRWRDIAMVFQGSMNALNPVVRIGPQLSEAAIHHGLLAPKQASARVDELLQQVGLSLETAQRFPHEMSGGMRQRAVIAMALSCNPHVLLADEPTTALDVVVQQQVMQLVLRLAEEHRLGVILVSHDLPLVISAADTTHVMLGGAIVESGSSAGLRARQRHPYTRTLFEALDIYGPVAAPPVADAVRPPARTEGAS